MHKTPSKARSDRGFTLIELMVTVAIIGIIATIAVPSYRVYVKKNTEEQARQRALSIATELSSWRSKKLSYAGFIPKNDGCATGEYCYSTGNSVYVPLGSTASNYKYEITIVDGTTFNSLTATDAAGRSWRLKASPNTSVNLVKTADTYYLDSLGSRCVYDHTVATTLKLNSTTVACSGAGVKSF